MNFVGYDNWIEVQDEFCSFDFSQLKIRKKEDCIDYTVEKITDNFENLYVALSGGLDSEFAANSLFERQVKFTPIIMDIGCNKIENWYAYRWCHEKNIKPLIISLTEEEVVKHFSKISQEMNIPFYVSINVILSEIVKKRDGSLILGGEEFIDRDYFLGGELKKMSRHLSVCDHTFCVERRDRSHVGGFTQYTSDLVFNLLQEMNYEKPGQIALSEYYNVLPRPKINSHLNLALSPTLKQAKSLLDKDKVISVYEMSSKDDFLSQAKNLNKVKLLARKVTLPH
jgi:hypothetical protein